MTSVIPDANIAIKKFVLFATNAIVNRSSDK